MVTSPIASRICAIAAMPGACTPSSFVTRMRYGGTVRSCAPSGASSQTATSRARNTRMLRMPRGYQNLSAVGRAQRRRYLVEDEAALDLFHRDPLRLVRHHAVFAEIVFVDPGEGTAAQLLRPHRGHIDVEESALDRRCLRPGRGRRVGFGDG